MILLQRSKPRYPLLGLAALWMALIFPSLLQAESAVGAGTPLQPLIDQTESGGTLVLEPGHYIGPAVITRPIHIEAAGAGVRIDNDGESPAITLQASDSSITGLQIVDEMRDRKMASVLVSGSRNRLENLHITTRASGIQLREAHTNVLEGLKIERPQEAGTVRLSSRGNGIDLWGSHDNLITQNYVTHMHDGIYLESSESNRVENNKVDFSRYGYHFMFTKDSFLIDNEGEYNVTGGMVMSSDNTEVTGNSFTEQSENVNSQGLLLYDVNQTIVTGNRVEGNRVGFYIEQAKDSRLEDNWIARNFIGMEMLQSENNEVSGNHFISNVNQAQATTSANNAVRANYWDDFQGVDLDGSGFSDLVYRTHPFFITLTQSASAYQLFFQSPGMVFLQGLFPIDSAQSLTDEAPLMNPVIDTGGNGGLNGITLAICALLFVFSIIIIYVWGIRRQ
ncbi:nitrous oxide reductase family maturation protein NosD [Paenibacillus sp. J2TS4]|uniref:right-handed parallel beta-helix repeat-containing protein n=1 Tax=Paenibacillus sp. J2TS4 TaxID=2807194 RepID=UPI001B03FA93|nr:NosD domain-containing protein [Paenibacillus sp. J2TS4]GIP34400.1 copper-binding periplasmic protein [Paenibacillus sp. J2TS4]